MSLRGIGFDWKLSRLELNTTIKPFESEDDDLNDFLLKNSKDYLAQMLAVTYLIETDTETVAYFCLSNDSLRREIKELITEEEKRVWNKLSRQFHNSKRIGTHPSVKTGRLAVTKKYAQNGFGQTMLDFVKNKYREENQPSGCRFITVDAYTNATHFYIKNGFDFLTDKDKNNKTRAMFFDLKAAQ